MFGNKRKKHFINKLADVDRTIWDLEFKRFKTREIREEIRVEFDQTKARLTPLNELLATKDKKKDKEEIEQINKQIEEVNENANRFLAQMQHLDVEIGGSEANERYPEGHQGLNQQLDALRELQQMIKEYLKII